MFYYSTMIVLLLLTVEECTVRIVRTICGSCYCDDVDFSVNNSTVLLTIIQFNTEISSYYIYNFYIFFKAAVFALSFLRSLSFTSRLAFSAAFCTSASASGIGRVGLITMHAPPRPSMAALAEEVKACARTVRFGTVNSLPPTTL